MYHSHPGVTWQSSTHSDLPPSSVEARVVPMQRPFQSGWLVSKASEQKCHSFTLNVAFYFLPKDGTNQG